MATVSTLIYRTEAFLYSKAKDISNAVKIAMLNAAKDEVWKLMVGHDPQANWFMQTSQNSASGSPYYFADMATDTREYSLPTELHQLRQIEVTTSGWETLEFTKSQLDDDYFRRLRAQPEGSDAGEILYDIYGGPPGSLTLARYPPAALAIKLWFIARPTEWDSVDDSVAEFPSETHNMICEWAAQRILLPVGSPEWTNFVSQWDRNVTRWMLTARRDNTGPETVKGFME